MTAFKAVALLSALLLSTLGVAPVAHAAHDMSPEGLEWKRISEDNMFLNAIAYSKGSQSYPIALVVLVNSSTFTTGIDKTTLRSDYLVRQINFDCTNRGRFKIWKSWAYRVGSDQPVKIHPLTDVWEVATSFHGPLEEWKVICGEKSVAAGDHLPKRNTFDAITTDYRARYAQKKAQAEADKQERNRRLDEQDAREMAEFAKSQMSPEIATGRAFGPGKHHWHYVFATPEYLGAIDVHRIVEGASPHLKRVSTVMFVANPTEGTGPSNDYIVKFEEFDCNAPGQFRSLAGASYKKGGQVQVAYQSPNSKWTSYSASNPMSRFWEWACKGDQKINTLQSNQSFDQILETYREQVRGAQ